MANKYQVALKDTKELLGDLYEATKSGSFLYLPGDICEILLKKGWGEVNDEIVNDEGHKAARLTEAGATEAGINTGDSISPDDTSAKEVHELEPDARSVRSASQQKEAIHMYKIEDKQVVKKRANSGNQKYPFDQLEIGQSFFVPATKERPEPWKSLAGAITVANKKASELMFDESGNPIMRINKRGTEVQATRPLKKFAMQKDTVDGVNGVRMGRIMIPA